MRGARNVARMKDTVNIYKNLVGKSEERSHFADIARRTVVKLGFKKMGCEDQD
jgi:hypothetical protein